MLLKQTLIVGLGGGLGAVTRWLIGVSLNQLFPFIALGTLGANWLGAFFMGLLFGTVQFAFSLNAYWQLFLATGFLGGLTTFSTFTAEGFTLLQQQYFFYLFLHLLLHLVGSFLCFYLGWFLIKTLSS